MDVTLTESNTPNALSRKRRKKSSVSVGRAAPLSALPDLSIDILFEIFSHLLPLDLLHVTRTSKSFRKLLLDRKASTVWIAARERAFPNYPEPPDGVSEPFWANLVFGETVCEKCGNNKIRKVVFEWRCRLCTSCLKGSTMKESRILKIWPDSDKSIVDLLPYVTGLFGSSKTTRFYWNEDVIKIGALLDEIQLEVGRGTPGAAGGLQLFKQERMTMVKSILDHSKECWDASQGKARNVHELKQKRYQQHVVFDRFKALGYEERNIKAVLKTVSMPPTLLTEQAWDNIQRQFEPRLLHRRFLTRTNSATAGEPPQVEARRRLIAELCDGYCKDAMPIQRESIPPVGVVCTFPQFAEILQQPANVEVPREDFTRAIVNLGSFIHAWDGVVDMRMGAMAGWQTTGNDGDPNKLNLAWFVTTCAHPSHQDGSSETYRGDVAFSRREALFHLYHDHDVSGSKPYSLGCAPFQTLQFVEAGSTAVRSLIKLAGLNEDKAMPLNMDFTRARFICEHCDPEPQEDVDGLFKPVMDWRQAANHYVDCWRLGRADHPEPAWRMLNDLENEAVTTVEHDLEDMPEYQDDPRTWFWRCNHCRAFEPRSFVTTFLHVTHRHFVTGAKAGCDLYPDGFGVRAHKPAHYIRVDCDPRLVVLTRWNGVRKQIEPDRIALQETVDRININLFRERRQDMGEQYAEWLKRFTPFQLERMPKPRIVYGFPHVLAVTNAPRNRIGSEHYTMALCKLPEAIKIWQADVDRSLRTLKVKSGPTSLMHAILAIMPSLDAAMFVTECSHAAHDAEESSWGDVAFGKEEAVAHLMGHMDRSSPLDDCEPCSVNPGILSFLPSGSSAVVSVVEMLGLDEDTATPMDLDKAGAAFVCELCEPHQLLPNGDQLRTIFKWRQAAIHVIDRLRFGKVDHLSPSWRLLSARELRALKLAEEKCQLEPSYPLWVRCNLCLGERFDARSEMSMMEHLRSIHDISEPVLGQDFYYNPLKAGSLTPVHRICVEPAPDAAVRIRSIGEVGTKLSYSELDYRGV